jgi:hypothetical protein
MTWAFTSISIQNAVSRQRAKAMPLARMEPRERRFFGDFEAFLGTSMVPTSRWTSVSAV